MHGNLLQSNGISIVRGSFCLAPPQICSPPCCLQLKAPGSPLKLPQTGFGPGLGKGRSRLRITAKKWWGKKKESDLSRHVPLPLPLTFPNPAAASPEEVEKAKSCNPELEDCKDVIYEWTDKCRACYATGYVSFYRKNGKEVTSQCITCCGIGYVQRITTRDDVGNKEDNL